MNRSTKALFGLALGLLMVGAGCAKQSSVTTPEPTTPPAPSIAPGEPSPTEPTSAMPVPGTNTPETEVKADADLKADAALGTLKEVKITAKQFSFTPAEVRVKQGERVRLVVTNEDVSHGIAIPAFNVSLTLEPGKTGTTEFVADKKGSFPFFCNVFCGSGHGGMRGTLIVE